MEKESEESWSLFKLEPDNPFVRFQNLGSAVAFQANAQPNKRAYIFLGEKGEEKGSFTFQQLDSKARQIATLLLQTLGLKKGKGDLLRSLRFLSSPPLFFTSTFSFLSLLERFFLVSD
jgi:hypothetical protein